MKEWSKYYQNIEFIKKSRIQIMNKELTDLVVRWININEQMKVLDVGCGTGEFTYYLASKTQNVKYFGIDSDKTFIEEANKNKLKNESNEFNFLTGDALSLTYTDDTFDKVVSQTFLTAVKDYIKAIKEMIRVCKTGGSIVSLAPARVGVPIVDTGVYDRDIYKWKDRYDELYTKLISMYEAIAPISEMHSGIDPGRIPYAFSELGLKNIRVYPIGKFFSLSNDATSYEDKKNFIEQDYISEIKKMDAIYENNKSSNYMTKSEFDEMKEILKERRDSLLLHINDNNTWDWVSGCNLLVIGDKI